MFDGMTPAQVEGQFDTWLGEARRHEREMWASYAMAAAAVARLKKEKTKCLSHCLRRLEPSASPQAAPPEIP